MSTQIQRSIVRLFIVISFAGLNVIAMPRTARAQPYPVRWFSPPEKATGEFQCLDSKNVAANTPDSTNCWAVIVWYKGSWYGFNNYSVGGSAAWTANYACPEAPTLNRSSVLRDVNPERLRWYAFIQGPTGFVTTIDGQVTYQGGLGGNLTLSGIDASKCNYF